MATAQQESMLRKQILMPPLMADRVQKIAKARGVSFGEIIRDAVDAFDDTFSKEDAQLLDTMAEALIASTRDTIQRIDNLMQRLDETHTMLEKATHGDR